MPLNPLFNTAGMLRSAQELLECLVPTLELLPFPQADIYELWMLDEATGNPFALLESARTETELEQKPFKRWSAAGPGDFSFVSQQLKEQELPENDGHNPRIHATVLEALVRGRSGQNHRRAWYLRDADTGGTAVSEGVTDQPASAFPELPVSLDWQESEDYRLVMDYISWKAPKILLLSGLPPSTRDMVERLAVKNSAQIERLWRLFPEIHNKTLLNKARVEARIRLSNQI